MSSTESIICRPTPWFRYRAGVIFLIFSVFAALFYMDGSTGYRKKNKVYYLHQCFKNASQAFSDMNADNQLTRGEWAEFASSQIVSFEDDQSILPTDMELPMKWPVMLQDFDRMKSLQWNQLWLEYSEAEGLDSTPPDKAYDARAIRQQWLFFWIAVFNGLTKSINGIGYIGSSGQIIVTRRRRTW